MLLWPGQRTWRNRPTDACSAREGRRSLLHRAIALTSLTLTLAASAPAAARALEPEADEKQRLEACEARLCEQILDKKRTDGSLTCELSKTWGRRDIKKGAKQKDLDWGYGGARCKVGLALSRADIVYALSAPKYEIKAPYHEVRCDVETSSGVQNLKARIEPRLKFKNGRVYKVRIRLRDIDGPEPLSSFVWTTSKLADNFGLFHSEMVEEINKFMHKKCAQKHGPDAKQAKD